MVQLFSLVFLESDGAKCLLFLMETVKFEPHPCTLSSPPRSLVSVYFTNTPKAHTSRERPLWCWTSSLKLFVFCKKEKEMGRETVLLPFEGGN